MRTHKVKDWMSREPVTISPDLGIGVAHQMMLLHEVRRLPVIDDGDRLVGIVARSDIREARAHADAGLNLWEVHQRLTSVLVKDVMCESPLTVTPESTVYDAAKIMLDHKVGGLPVVEDGVLVGIITESDIFRMLVRTFAEEDD